MNFEEIKEKFDAVIKHSQDYDFAPNTEQLLSTWREKKSRFYGNVHMNGELIYECPDLVSFEMTESMKTERREHFLELLWDIDPAHQIYSFINANDYGFYDNKTVESYTTIDGVTIPAGVKIGRALKKFMAPYADEETLEHIRIEMSKIIQENKVSGHLCLSVHPLDFLSSSENNYNWRSCHSLDGEYRAGNLSYMLDDCTVMVYLKGEDDVTLPRFPESVPWNNKKWRCLFFFDKNRHICWAGRQYPFCAENALSIVRQMIFEPMNYFEDVGISKAIQWNQCVAKGTISWNGLAAQESNGFLESKYVNFQGTMTPMSEWVADAPHSMHFDDLLCSSFYLPYMINYGCNTKDMVKAIKTPMVIGGSIPCAHCGKEPVYNSETMLCRECMLESDEENNDIVYCANCGQRIIADDSFLYNDEFYCDECHDELFSECGKCGQVHLESEMTWDEKKMIWVCADHSHKHYLPGWLDDLIS